MFLYPVITRGYLCVSLVITLYLGAWFACGCAFNNNNLTLWSVTHHLIIYRLFLQSNCSTLCHWKWRNVSLLLSIWYYMSVKDSCPLCTCAWIVAHLMMTKKMKFLSPTIKGFNIVLFVCLFLLREQFIDISFFVLWATGPDMMCCLHNYLVYMVHILLWYVMYWLSTI